MRCSKAEKELLVLLAKRASEKLGGERISNSEIMRLALEKMAIDEFGIQRVNQILEKDNAEKEI